MVITFGRPRVCGIVDSGLLEAEVPLEAGGLAAARSGCRWL
jgi:hypothetical protein